MFLYLTTRGWKTGRSHQIEIWFVKLDGHFYLISEKRLRSHWVQNLKRDPSVSFRVGDKEFRGKARTVEAKGEGSLKRRVEALFQTKYGWSEGLMVQLTPDDLGTGSGVQ